MDTKTATLLQRIATAQTELTHQPDSEPVRLAYRALKKSLAAQYEIVAAYLNLEFVTIDPYQNSAQMFGDIRYRHRLKVYTDADMPCSHPFASVHSSGQTYNTVFRAVHDALVHFPARHTFGPIGEFRAFQTHARLLTGNTAAIHALATETLGQNAWVNFGPRSHETPKPYAPQVANLLPWSLVVEALEHTT